MPIRRGATRAGGTCAGCRRQFAISVQGTRLIAIEPNRHFHKVLRGRTNERGIELDLRGLSGDALDLPDASVDLVFSSLVLCSVSDPLAVTAEVLRVLKSGGRFACVDLVEAPAGTMMRSLQHTIASPWKWVFEGCDLCRDTGATLGRAGFSQVNVQRMVLPTMFVPIRHQITAMCVK